MSTLGSAACRTLKRTILQRHDGKILKDEFVIYDLVGIMTDSYRFMAFFTLPRDCVCLISLSE